MGFCDFLNNINNLLIISENTECFGRFLSFSLSTTGWARYKERIKHACTFSGAILSFFAQANHGNQDSSREFKGVDRFLFRFLSSLSFLGLTYYKWTGSKEQEQEQEAGQQGAQATEKPTSGMIPNQHPSSPVLACSSFCACAIVVFSYFIN